MSVAIHEAIDKADGVVFRGTLSGGPVAGGCGQDVRAAGDAPRSAAADHISFC
jgi:hypothetical protein